MCDYCNHIKDILDVERDLIQSHIAKHRWCNRFKNDNEAIIDFVHKYAWLMREVFCGVMCAHRGTCNAADQFKVAFLEDISDDELEKYIKLNYEDNELEVVKIKLQVLKHDIKTHKWLNKIDNYDEAVKDFLNKFGWVIYEMYKRSKQQYEGK